MPKKPTWLNRREARAWRSFMHAQYQVAARVHRHLLEDSGLTAGDYEILAVLSGHPTGRMPAQELSALLQYEKSRLSHQMRRMEERGFISCEPNPADGRSAMVSLLPLGRRAIKDAAPGHVRHVREHFIALLTPAELDALATINEQLLRHLAEEPFPEESAPDHHHAGPRLPRGRGGRPRSPNRGRSSQ